MCDIAKYHIFFIFGRVILRTLEKLLVFGVFLEVEEEEDCFICAPIFLCRNI